jgi:hypothetical protein
VNAVGQFRFINFPFPISADPIFPLFQFSAVSRFSDFPISRFSAAAS